MANGLEFEWDDENRNHQALHKVTPAEFEQVMRNDPLDRDFDMVEGEERYRSVGLTDGGRFLLVIWTVRQGRVRAVTAFPATVASKRIFLKRLR